MPYALILHCNTQNEVISHEDLQGQKTLAIFLQELIQKQDPALATMLHAPKNSKPFTTAILKPLGSNGLGRPEDKRPVHRSKASHGDQGEMKMRITLLDDALYPLISQFFLQHIGGIPTLHLGRSALVISKVSVTPESGEPWAGFASFETILAQRSETETSWRLCFATPTAFKSGDADLPLPIPRLCFQSWLNSWDEHAPSPFFPDKAERKRFLEEVVEGQVSVDFSQLRTEEQGFYFDGHRTRERGFTGVCRFTVKPAKIAPQPRQILGTLVRYSFYAGTGRKTTMGMGVTGFMGPDRR
ncbi:MAG: CRISPR system precrRNA processing endoribonuclease RAMP protein Cas6 [Candidatus Entotheonellia bacterium]